MEKIFSYVLGSEEGSKWLEEDLMTDDEIVAHVKVSQKMSLRIVPLYFTVITLYSI